MKLITKLKHYNQIRKYWLTMLGFDRIHEIKKINIELCSICNLHCQYCNFKHHNNRLNFIDAVKFESILCELKYLNYNVRQLNLSHSGEVLLHPNFKKLVRLLKAYKKNGMKVKKIAMNTNLMLLNNDIIDFLNDIDVFDIISCSIDGKDKKSFERLRKGANYEKCIKNFKCLALTKKRRHSKFEIRINNGNDKESSKLEYDMNMLDCFDLADKIIHYNFHNWTGDIKVEGYFPSKNKGFCEFMFNTVTIMSNGDVGKCCNDLNGKTTYGSIKYKTLKQVYHSKKRKEFLKLMYKKQRHKVKGCKICTRQ